MRRAWVVVMIAIAGCHGSSGSSSSGGAGAREPEPPAGPTCESVMPKMTEASVAILQDNGAGPDITGPAHEDAVRIEPELVRACTQDRWSPELLRCIDETAPVEMGKCEQLVTPEQRDSVIRIRNQAPADRQTGAAP